MDLSPDFADLFRTLNKYKVRYLVVGAYAVVYYTQPRYTKDLDIWVDPSQENARRIYNALGEFGAPLKNISSCHFTNPRLIYQIGIAPVRVDILMSLKGLEFKSAWKNKKKARYGNISINIIGIHDLIVSKEASLRDEDARDVKRLKEILGKR